MKFNSGEDSIVNNVLDELSITIDQFPLTKIARAANRSLERMSYIIMKSDSNAQWDDTNHTDFPIASINLVEGQRAYSILEDESQIEILKLLTVSVSDENDNWSDIEVVDIRDDKAIGLRLRDTDNGTPTVADWQGDSLFLDPAPDYAKVKGMRLYFQRSPKLFTSTDTTEEAGFAKIFHDYIVQHVCERWAKSKDQQKFLNFKTQRMEMEQDIEDYFGDRDVTSNTVALSADPDPF